MDRRDAVNRLALIKQTIAGSTTTTVANYIYADQIDTPRVITRASDNKMQWRWDQADPFGLAPANENPQALGAFTSNARFPGQLYDKETNLHYNWHRDYDPQLGRYIQSDPIGSAGGINTFAYVEGQPLTLVDPEGLRRTIVIPSTMGRQQNLPGMSTPTGAQPLPSTTTHYSTGNLTRAARFELLKESLGNFDKNTPSNLNWGDPLPGRGPSLVTSCTLIVAPTTPLSCSAQPPRRLVCGPTIGPR